MLCEMCINKLRASCCVRCVLISSDQHEVFLTTPVNNSQISQNNQCSYPTFSEVTYIALKNADKPLCSFSHGNDLYMYLDTFTKVNFMYNYPITLINIHKITRHRTTTTQKQDKILIGMQPT